MSAILYLNERVVKLFHWYAKDSKEEVGAPILGYCTKDAVLALSVMINENLMRSPSHCEAMGEFELRAIFRLKEVHGVDVDVVGTIHLHPWDGGSIYLSDVDKGVLKHTFLYNPNFVLIVMEPSGKYEAWCFNGREYYKPKILKLDVPELIFVPKVKEEIRHDGGKEAETGVFKKLRLLRR